MKLNVFINKRKVGELSEAIPLGSAPGADPDLVFKYDDNVDLNDFISLTMPVTSKPYTSKNLHAIFKMILPEGRRAAQANKFAKITRADDMGILAIVGENTIGRVQVSIRDQISKQDGIPIEGLLQNGGRELFDELLEKSGFKSGVAGVQPKMLVSNGLSGLTLNTSTHIVKTFEDDYPWLTVNEYFCLLAADRSGIETPDFQLSNDGRVLAVKRFDICEAGGDRLGFEEIIVMNPRAHNDKYIGCLEDIVDTIDQYIESGDAVISLRQLFKQIVFSVITGNGDAHMKNFGLLYDNNSIRLAPAYDLVCTTAYSKNDMPALSLDNETYAKKWWNKSELKAFGVTHCFLNSKDVNAIYQEVADGISETLPDIAHYSARNKEFNVIGESMLERWCDAMDKHDMKTAKQEAGPRNDS